MSNKTLIIVDNLEGRVLDLLNKKYQNKDIEILSLGFTKQLFLRDSKEKTKGNSIQYTFVDISQKHRLAQSLTQDYCLQLKMNLPKKTIHKDDSLFDVFNFKDFNIWWFLGFSEMGSFRIKFIDQIYFLTLIKLVLENNYHAIYIDLNDSHLKHVLEDYLFKQKISFSSAKSKQKKLAQNVKEQFLLWWFISMLLFVITQILKTTFFRIFSIGFRPVKNVGFVSFFSFFPALWSKKTDQSFKNSIFNTLLDYTNDFHQAYHLIYTIRLRSSAKTVISNLKRFKQQKIIFLEKYVPLKGFLFFCNYKYLVSIIRYHLVFRKKISEKYEGYNISRLITKSIDVSLSDKELYRDIFIFHSLKSFTKKYIVKGIVHPSEFQCYEKSIWYSVAGICPAIALQHSAIGKNWLNYYFNKKDIPSQYEDLHASMRMPLPELFLCSGEYQYQVLKQNSIPINKIKLCGAFRYNHLHETISKRRNKTDLMHELGFSDKTIIILSLGGVNLQESIDMVYSIAEYLKYIDREIQILFKSHPLRIIDQEVEQIFKTKCAGKKWKIIPAHYNYIDYISISNLTCFCNSTIGIESIALGVHALSFDNIHSFVSYDMIEVGDAVFHVKNKADFIAAIQDILSNSSFLKTIEKSWNDAISKTFYKLDGKANERFISILSTVLKQGN
ncbi:MAG: hypothetical protein Q8P20_08820 [bacterium]|nr:hypothetical protein [bacterium]